MKVRIAIAGCVMVALVVGAFVIAAMQSRRTSVDELRGYFESVPDSLGWTIASRRDWDKFWRDERGEMSMMERWLDKLPWKGSHRGYVTYEFKKGDDYVHVDAYFKYDSIDWVKIYRDAPLDMLALELEKDLRKRYPHMKVEIFAYSD